MIRILYLSQFFTSPAQPGISRAWMLAQHLGSNGYKVDVIASKTDYMTGRNFDKNGKPGEDCELPEGVTLKTVNTYFKGKSKIKRLLQYIIYCITTLFYGCRGAKPDVVLASSPPIFVGLVGCWLAKLRGARYIFEVRDPWPDALIYFGVFKKSVFIDFLYRLETYIYKKADLIVALSPGIKKLIENKGIPAGKITVITNGYDSKLFERDGELIYPKQSQESKISKVIYVGSLGKINETEYLMETVDLLRDTPDLIFEFIGEGLCKENMMQIARERGLTNIKFLPPVSKELVPQVLSTGDIAIVFTKPGLYSEIGLHNKIFDYLGAGLPVVATGGGDLKRLIETAGAGFTVTPRDVVGVADKIRYLHHNRDIARQMGEQGRNFIVRYYKRELLLAAYEKQIRNLVSNQKEKSVGC